MEEDLSKYSLPDLLVVWSKFGNFLFNVFWSYPRSRLNKVTRTASKLKQLHPLWPSTEHGSLKKKYNNKFNLAWQTVFLNLHNNWLCKGCSGPGHMTQRSTGCTKTHALISLYDSWSSGTERTLSGAAAPDLGRCSITWPGKPSFLQSHGIW